MNGSSNTSVCGKTPRRIADHGPDDVRHTVDRLIHQLRRRAAELHRGIALDLDPSAGFLFDRIRPDIEDELGDDGLRGQELMQLCERDLLRRGGQAGEGKRGSAEQRSKGSTGHHRSFLPECGRARQARMGEHHHERAPVAKSKYRSDARGAPSVAFPREARPRSSARRPA